MTFVLSVLHHIRRLPAVVLIGIPALGGIVGVYASLTEIMAGDVAWGIFDWFWSLWWTALGLHHGLVIITQRRNSQPEKSR